MKKILITGANGQLGRAISKEYAREDVELIRTDVVVDGETISLDITKVEEVMALVQEKQPDVIINCAAHTNVDKCEEQWDLAYKINAIGPRNLSIAATAVGAKMIHISTDYVFEGNSVQPITEFDLPNPISAYGKTKYEGEKFVKEFASKYFILRTAWLYGEGNNFVKTMLALSETHKKLDVVCDQVGSPTSAVELAKLIHYLEPTDNYGMFHATCEGDTNWADFAEKIFELAHKEVKINHVTSVEYKELNPKSADRPTYSILEDYMIKLTSNYRMADWIQALESYINKLK